MNQLLKCFICIQKIISKHFLQPLFTLFYLQLLDGKSMCVSKIIFSSSKQLKNSTLVNSVSNLCLSHFGHFTQSTWNNQKRKSTGFYAVEATIRTLRYYWKVEPKTEGRKTTYITHYTVYIISILFTTNKDKLMNLTCLFIGPYGGPGKVLQGGGEIWLMFTKLLLAQIECFLSPLKTHNIYPNMRNVRVCVCVK